MATFTRLKLIERVLENLQTLGVAQTPTADDSEIIGEKLDNIHAQLGNRGLTNDGGGVWTIETVPDYVAESYIALALNLAARAFHVKREDMPLVRLDAVQAENEIRRQVAVFNDREPVKAEQF